MTQNNEGCLALDALSVRPQLERIWQVLPQARLVGGAVRDLLAGRAVSDFDLATPEPPEDVMQRLESAGIKAVPTGLAHGTVTAVLEGCGFEITTLRRDVKTDGRHAEVAWTQDWREDAARRDFTINAMSCDPTGRVHDFFGGRADLKAGWVRFVGDAALRIREDALRVLRYFRFEARYGRGARDAATVQAVSAGAALIAGLSVERVWSELKRILSGPRVGETLGLMDATGVLRVCLPELQTESSAAVRRVEALLASGAPADGLLRLTALLQGAHVEGDDVEAAVKRLRLSRTEAAFVVAVCNGAAVTPGDMQGDADTARLLARVPREVALGRAWLARAQVRERGQDEPGWDGLLKALGTRRVPEFPVAGRDLLALGIAPGPEVGRHLAAVRAWWEAGGCVADRIVCLEWLERRLAA
ncbi:CCA tRNA nucleotidyltransferase [Acetobacter estunensis]|uniref:CCA tRNA nucleotidyltransferase n=1 Tax=Acetobacter estunensis TaxID=104097 RepID=UPI001C2CCBEA|nr:CCA tRNA nucleotidyltransferase [Acetobacter estunensis]MBV1838364.1 CCA tRNA nucleotidyltransferase [Acetobacter estunensis]